MVCNVPVSAKANGNRNQVGAWLDSGLIVGYTSHLVRVQLRNMLTIRNMKEILSCQPRVTVTSCSVNKVIRDLESIDHLCINPIRMIGLIHT